MPLFCSWWAITTYLGWSLLGVSEDFDPMNSVDFPSEILARILYAGFLIMGVVLLINMLIALLSNTYQRIQVSDYVEISTISAAKAKRSCSKKKKNGKRDLVPTMDPPKYSTWRLFLVI